MTSGLGDTSNVSSGGVALQGEFLLDSSIDNLSLGGEVGYLRYSHAVYPAIDGSSGYNRYEYFIPILAVVRYRFYDGFFGEAKAGVSLDRTTTDSATFSNQTTPYFALGADLGYSLALGSGFSIEPKVNAYLSFVSGAYAQIAPTVSVGYRF